MKRIGDSVKGLKERLDGRVKRDEIERDEEGRAVIGMTVLRDDDFLSCYSAGETPVISAEIAAFLEENTLALRPGEPLHVRIDSDCIDETEREIYCTALREYYVRRYKRSHMQLRRNALAALIMAMIGFLTLAAVVVFSVLGTLPVLSEVIDIFAWVFLWESVDLFFLQRTALRYERDRYLHFIDAVIEFRPLQKP